MQTVATPERPTDPTTERYSPAIITSVAGFAGQLLIAEAAHAGSGTSQAGRIAVGSERGYASSSEPGTAFSGGGKPPGRGGSLPENHDPDWYMELKRRAYRQANEFALPNGWDENRETESGFAIDLQPRDCDDMISPLLKHADGNRIFKVSMLDTSYLQGYDDILAFAEYQGESRYFSDGDVDPMLPPRISENILSLLQRKEKPTPTLTLHALLSPRATVVDARLELSAGKAHNITYDQANRAMAGQGRPTEGRQLRELFFLAKQLLANRARRGAFAMYNPEKGLRTSAEGDVVRMPRGRGDPAQLIVQESMIFANSVIAQIAMRNGIDFLYRNHAFGDAVALQQAWRTISQGEVSGQSLLHGFYRNFGRAVYDTVPFGHEGLGVPLYAHVTSSGRRFGDLMDVTNLVTHQREKDKNDGSPITYPYPTAVLSDSAIHLNSLHRIIIRDAKNTPKLPTPRQELPAKSPIPFDNPIDLMILDNETFNDVANTAAGNAEMPSAFTIALAQRLSEEAVRTHTLANLLASSHALHETWESTIDTILGYLHARPHIALMVLDELKEQGYIDAEASTVEGAQTALHFTGIARLTDLDGIHYRATVLKAPNSHAAKGAAASDVLAASLGRRGPDESRVYVRPKTTDT